MTPPSGSFPGAGERAGRASDRAKDAARKALQEELAAAAIKHRERVHVLEGRLSEVEADRDKLARELNAEITERDRYRGWWQEVARGRNQEADRADNAEGALAEAELVRDRAVEALRWIVEQEPRFGPSPTSMQQGLEMIAARACAVLDGAASTEKETGA